MIILFNFYKLWEGCNKIPSYKPCHLIMNVNCDAFISTSGMSFFSGSDDFSGFEFKMFTLETSTDPRLNDFLFFSAVHIPGTYKY